MANPTTWQFVTVTVPETPKAKHELAPVAPRIVPFLIVTVTPSEKFRKSPFPFEIVCPERSSTIFVVIVILSAENNSSASIVTVSPPPVQAASAVLKES